MGSSDSFNAKNQSTVLLLVGMCMLYAAGVLTTLHADPSCKDFVSSVALPFDLVFLFLVSSTFSL